MRIKTIELNGHKYKCVLLAGGFGGKIYSILSGPSSNDSIYDSALLFVAGKFKRIYLPVDSHYWDLRAFVLYKYMPVEKQESIVDKYKNIAEKLSYLGKF